MNADIVALEYPGGFLRDQNYNIRPALYTYSRNKSDRTNRIIHPRGFELDLPSIDLEGASVLCGGVISHFGHTYIDTVDRLCGVNRDPRLFDYIVFDTQTIPEQCNELFSLIFPELTKVKRLYADQATYYNGKFVAPENMSEKPFWSSVTVDFLRVRIAALVPPQRLQRSILLRRGNVTERCLINEEEVERIILRSGGISVNPASLSIIQQWQVISSAKLVAGVIGSNLFNLFAAKPGTKVIAFVPVAYLTAKGDNLLMLKDLCNKLSLELTTLPMVNEKSRGFYPDAGYVDAAALERALG